MIVIKMPNFLFQNPYGFNTDYWCVMDFVLCYTVSHSVINVVSICVYETNGYEDLNYKVFL